MTLKPINLNSDSRVSHNTAILNGHTYHYLYGVPQSGTFRATVFLIHGWPDISAGWRYQIPVLLEMGCRVVAPDLMGFGGTDAPRVPPAPLQLYGYKRAADDIAELARQLNAQKIILGGHDWGGMVVWRTAAWHPEFVTHVFVVCTPYNKPQKEYQSAEDLVKGPLPQFGYQLQLASPEVEARIQTKQDIRNFLNGMYGGRGKNGEVAFNPEKGLLFENLPKLGKTVLLSDDELDYYTDQYYQDGTRGLHGTVNWYRTRRINYEDDLGLKKDTIDIPTLFVLATRDNVLTPELSVGMDKYVPNLTRREVDAGHWALWQKPELVNRFVKEWLEEVVFGGKSKL